MIGFSRRQWALALVTALLVHLGGVALYLRAAEPKGAVQAGVGGVIVALGPAGAAPGAVAANPPPTEALEVEAEEREALDEPVEELSDEPPEEAAPGRRR